MTHINNKAGHKNRSLKYVQVKETILNKILSGEWANGCRIPVESEFCEMFGVSRITVRKALDELQAEGYLEKIQGKGTFVRNEPIEQWLSKFYSFSDELKNKGMEERAQMLEFSVVSARDEVAEKLEVRPGSQVYRIYRLRVTNPGPYALETSYIPCELVPTLTRESVCANGLYKTLSAAGRVVDSAVEQFSAVNVSSEVSKLLKVRVDAAAISLERIAYSGSRVIEYCESIVRGDFFRYRLELS